MKYMEMMGQDTDFVNNLVKVMSVMIILVSRVIITETLSTAGHSSLLRAGGSICRSQEHQSHHPEEAGHPQTRNESFLREVQ